MKNKKLCGLVIVAALMANVTLFAFAFASTTGQTTSSVVISGISGLTIDSVPASVNFTGTSVSTSSQDLGDVTFSTPVQFSDLRSTNAGYSLVATAQYFTSGVNYFPYQQFEMSGDNDATLTAVGSSGCTAGVTVNNTVAMFSGTGEISDAKSLVSADTSVVRVDTCTFTPTIDVTIPGSQAAGTYTSTITYSIS
ncbi:MAG: hypothetical protein UV80_C0001G0039 [Candidatus Peregrinibacteria bacterium GW2011_GWF2_43_17]|nr:MAG: hypothetical protein UV80_C0001G0039 [Candidatus Peregrinibacteria bacterium GW2011_GWF2_43_17]HAU40281.1 hypothetical protein [Candidatus Peregrinibacteria bacterium]